MFSKMVQESSKSAENSTVSVGSVFGRMVDAPQKPYLRSKLHGECTQDPMSSTIKTWHSELRAPLKVKSLPPITVKTDFHDAGKLFGTNFDKKVTLREAGHLEACKDIILTHFDPNFQSTDVYCRQPSCGNRNPEAAKGGKRDLYLCPLHRKNLITSIENALAMRKIDISKSKEVLKEEQFTGYTSFIGLLEHAYHNSKKFGSLQKGELTPMIEEAILNVRNVLIITSTLLNPDVNNLALTLSYVFNIFKLILHSRESATSLVADLVFSLKEVTEMILSAFGVVYRWVSDALPRPEESRPGRQIGAGLGGATGLAVGFFFGPLGAGIAGLTAGVYLGSLIGNGIDLLLRRPRFPVYICEGNTSGGLFLSLQM